MKTSRERAIEAFDGLKFLPSIDVVITMLEEKFRAAQDDARRAAMAPFIEVGGAFYFEHCGGANGSCDRECHCACSLCTVPLKIDWPQTKNRLSERAPLLTQGELDTLVAGHKASIRLELAIRESMAKCGCKRMKPEPTYKCEPCELLRATLGGTV